jgi:hypothetical protein
VLIGPPGRLGRSRSEVSVLCITVKTTDRLDQPRERRGPSQRSGLASTAVASFSLRRRPEVSGPKVRAIASPREPYVLFVKCVWPSGWTLAVIATSARRSASRRLAVTATIASLLVRTSSPSRSERRGSEPRSLSWRSRRLVPSAPPATTTPRVRCSWLLRRNHAPDRSVVIT